MSNINNVNTSALKGLGKRTEAEHWMVLSEALDAAKAWEAKAQEVEAVQDASWAWKAAKAYGGRKATAHLGYVQEMTQEAAAAFRDRAAGRLRFADYVYCTVVWG